MFILVFLFLGIPALIFLGTINAIVSGNRKKHERHERKLLRYSEPAAYKQMVADEDAAKARGRWIGALGAIALIIIGAVSYHPKESTTVTATEIVAATPVPTATPEAAETPVWTQSTPSPSPSPVHHHRKPAASVLAIDTRAEEPIKFTAYEAPWATVHRTGDGIRTQHIVINKADATEEGLQRLGRQLYEITSGDIAATINVFTDAWAATTKIEIEDMTPAQQKRLSKAEVGQFRKRAGDITFDYAPGGVYRGAAEGMSPEIKTLRFP